MRGLSLTRVVLPAAALALAVVAVLAVLDRLGDNARAAARQALLMRAAALQQSVLMPGSVLPCVDGSAGETVGNACEKRVFASAESTAAAVAYMGARIDLLRQADALVKGGGKGALRAVASTRRAVTLDRYGIAAHVLAERDGCTASQCAVFAMLEDANALKSNLKAQTFNQYVSRYAANWHVPAEAKGPALSALPAPVPNGQAGNAPAGEARAEVTPPGAATVGKPVSSRWKLPSADSIPAVSIMNPEPKLPKAIAEEIERDTSRKIAIERRKESKAQPASTVTQDSKNKQQAEKKRQEPGTPLQLTR